MKNKKSAGFIYTQKIINDTEKYLFILSYAVLFLLIAFLFNSPSEILQGLKNIILSPSTLITDYMRVGNVGAAFFNSGIMMLTVIVTAYVNKVHMNGSLIAVILTMGGFALFGKNLYNSFSIIAGVYLYTFLKKKKFSKYIVISFFGTSLSPLVSLITFGLMENVWMGVLMGNAAGLLVGIILPPLAGHFVTFHKGFSLYNIGFTCGVIGTLFMSIIRAFGKDSFVEINVLEGKNLELGILFISIFLMFMGVGFFLNGKSFRNYTQIFRHSGRLVEDFVILDGFPIVLINMGVLGLSMVGCVLLVQGQLNGATLGGILTVVGFGAFGKHPKNVLPIVLGVFLAAVLQVWQINSTSVILATLFGTTLAPIAGKFGWKAGVVAGFLHLTIVMNIGELHGGTNLYNNGFSGGLVAAILVPILETFRKEEE